jgi:hypothetical protein
MDFISEETRFGSADDGGFSQGKVEAMRMVRNQLRLDPHNKEGAKC